jgi:hypothetical protein
MPQPARDKANAHSTGSAAWTGRRSGRHPRHSSADIVLDALAGAAAGVAAVWVMDRIDWFNFRRGLDNRRTRQQTRQARPVRADMLGVQRSTVSSITRALQQAGLIRQGRGVITVIDRVGLESASCMCYDRVRRSFERLLPYTYRTASYPDLHQPRRCS